MTNYLNREATEAPQKTKRSSKSDIDKEYLQIRDFIVNCGECELDAIRVIAVFASGENEQQSFSATDAEYINRFLNHGIVAAGKKTADEVITYRRNRLDTLMNKAQHFCSRNDLYRVLNAGMSLAIDTNSAKKISEDIARGTFKA